MPQQPMNIVFPMAGLDEGAGFQNRAPYSTVDAQNVRPIGGLQQRARGGNRPGWGRQEGYTIDGELSSGNRVTMLAELSRLGEYRTDWEDDFSGESLSDEWSTIVDRTLPSLDGEGRAQQDGDNDACFAATTARADMEQDGAIWGLVGIFIVPYGGAYNGTYHLHALMNDSSPGDTYDAGTPANNSYGLHTRVTFTGTSINTIVYYNGGAAANQGSKAPDGVLDQGQDYDIGSVDSGWLVMEYRGTSVFVFFRGRILFYETQTGTEFEFGSWNETLTGRRFGFGLDAAAGDYSRIAEYRMRYKTTQQLERRQSQMLAICNGQLYREGSEYGGMRMFPHVAAYSNDFNTGVLQQTAELNSKLFIADGRRRMYTSTDGAGNAASTRARISNLGSNPDYTALANADQHCVVIHENADTVCVDVGGNPADYYPGVYGINAVYEHSIALTRDYVAPDAASWMNVEWSIECAARYIDSLEVNESDELKPLTEPVDENNDTHESDIPYGCHLACAYRARLVLAGYPRYSIYLSRVGDPLDFDFGADPDDVARAISLQASDAASPAQPVTAVAPWKDDHLIIGCDNSMWILRGDPAAGGTLDNFHREIGCVGGFAWCYTDGGEFCWMAPEGLFLFGPGVGVLPLSDETLPDELRDINGTIYDVLMSYDRAGRGIWIFIVGKDSYRGRRHWWYDLRTKGFWPVTVPSAQEPSCLTKRAHTQMSDDGVWLGCADGMIRRFHRDYFTDDGSALESYVLIGPLTMGQANEADAILTRIKGTLAKNSDPLTWQILADETPEAAKDATARADAQGTWNAGKNYDKYPKVRGGSFYIKLYQASSSGAKWALEAIQIWLEPAGMAFKV